MIEKCKFCNKDIKDLKPTQKGNHISNCKMNPKFIETINKRKKTKLENSRLKNPLIRVKLNCLYCEKEYEIDIVESYYIRGKYNKCCSLECARKYSFSNVDRNKTKIKNCKKCGKEINVNILSSDNVYCYDCKSKQKINEIRRNKKRILKDDIYVCKNCGEEICKHPDICKRFRLSNNVYEKYLGFDSTKKGTKYFYEEFYRIVNNLKNDYFDNELSLPEIGKKYKMNYQTVQFVFKSLEIDTRTCLEGSELSIKNGKPYKSSYKSGYHINWKGEKIHYRSNYEKEYYSILDNKNISYDVETLKIQYYDTQKKKFRIAIPDIYIENRNEIIEIKSRWTLDEINMKDRVKAYKKLGYNVKLIIGEGRNNFFKNSKEIIY